MSDVSHVPCGRCGKVLAFVLTTGSLTSLDVSDCDLDSASEKLLQDTVKDRSGFELEV